MKYTIQEAMESAAMYLVPEQVGPLTHCTPQYIRIMARERPERLPYMVMVSGDHVKIPRKPFLKWWQDTFG